MSEFQPTLFFGFQFEGKKSRLHQMFVDQTGLVDWRPVPMIDILKPDRPEAIAGYYDEDEDGKDD